MTMREFKLFIGGEFVDAADGESTETPNPSTGQPAGRVAVGGAEDMRRAVSAARKAADEGPWPSMKPQERSQIMLDSFQRIFERASEFAGIETEDAGHTVRMSSLFTVPYSNEFWRYLAELGGRIPYTEKVEPYGFPTESWEWVEREPYGVVGAIIPWNLPYMMAMWKIPPAIVTGNTIVLKPALETPLSAMALAEVLAETELPPGVVNIVPGHGPTAGEALVTDDRVDKVTFTGSTEVGRRIMQLASGNLKHVSLELGGKGPNILLDDADLDIAIPGSLWATYMHQGQFCTSGTRLFAPAGLYDEVTARLVELAESLHVGSAEDFASDMGPVLNKTQFDTIDRYVQIGQDEGAKLLTGGHRITEGVPEGGFYFEPTIFGDVDNGMVIAQEEIFGPVLSVIRYESVEDAVRMANDTVYGLSGGVWSRDIPRALAIARRLKAGSVWINDWHLLSPAAPHGGYKQSGLGREHGTWGLNQYLETKYIRVAQEATKDQKFWFQVLGV
jgi:aldehyde dehydrogenase (NAD+)